jgi:3-methyl-2-oxobutanoate hydroxymethyltransferase
MPTSAKSTKMTVPLFRSRKNQEKLTVLTCYEYSFARILDAAGIDCILVGDSVGMVVQGQPDSLSVTMDEMVYHTRVVRRGCQRALIVADLPFLSYQVSVEQAILNSGRLLKEGGAHAVKLEGGIRSESTIAKLVECDIPVMAHVGLTPQSVHAFGGFKVQREAERILADAKSVERAGAFAVVLEGIPTSLAAEITKQLQIPTIGIGAGPECDGQVLVLHDLLGLYPDFRPKFVKAYLDGQQLVKDAVEQYAKEVRSGAFPDQAHSFQ